LHKNISRIKWTFNIFFDFDFHTTSKKIILKLLNIKPLFDKPVIIAIYYSDFKRIDSKVNGPGNDNTTV